MKQDDDIGSKPWRDWSPEEILEFKQEPKTKKDRKRAEAEKLFKEPRIDGRTDK